MEVVRWGDHMADIFGHAHEVALVSARRSQCLSSHSGAVVFEVVEGKAVTLGTGYNAPTAPSLCCLRRHIHGGRNVELCTAVHAEQMAIMEAAGRLGPYRLGVPPTYLVYAKVKLHEDGHYVPVAINRDKLSCTLCSRLLAWYRIHFVFTVAEGFVVMDGDDFNMASLVNIRAMLEKGEE